MFADNSADTDNVKIIENIITVVRASQQNKVAIDYEDILNKIKVMPAATPEQIRDMTVLLYSLRDTNPYI